MNIKITLPVRTPVINFVPYAALPKAEKDAMVREVVRAVNAWYYEQPVGQPS